MASRKTVTYECEQCGSEIVVTSTGEGELSPIYCCGIEVMQITPPAGKKAVSPRKEAVKKVSRAKGVSKKSSPAQRRKPKK
jgi:Desulfoferrodoxin, N-terminal domain